MFGQHEKSRIIEVSSSYLYDKWRKVVVLLREYKNISSMSLKIYTMSLSNIDGYEIINHNSKEIQILSRAPEIGVHISLVLPTQVSNCHLI